MKEAIKKPPLLREANTFIMADGTTPATLNVETLCIICNPPGCTGAHELGQIAANYYIEHGGFELNLIESITNGFCGSCRARLKAEYFITKDQILSKQEQKREGHVLQKNSR